VPPVPQEQLHASPERTNVIGERDDTGGEEEERVNVAERRRMFENFNCRLSPFIDNLRLFNPFILLELVSSPLYILLLQFLFFTFLSC